jgi:glycyl-tRNA synthetase
MDIEELLGFAKRTGFFWPAAEIYGGAAGLFDYGHLGATLKRNFESEWLNFFVNSNGNYHLIEGSNMLPEKPLIASGHASRFNDVIVGCSSCKSYFRADVLLNELGIAVSEGAKPEELERAMKDRGVKCPKCGGKLMEPRDFNLMVDVSLGPEKRERGYLRPETAQSAYLNFFREFNLLRKKLPMGLAIMGRAYRNEISPRQGLYRLRELSQAELQIFFDPDKWEIEDAGLLRRELNVVLYSDGKARRVSGAALVKDFDMPEFYVYHMCLIDRFYRDMMHVPEAKLRFYELGGDEKAFYNKIHFDIQADIESWNGFREIGGLHYRLNAGLVRSPGRQESDAERPGAQLRGGQERLDAPRPLLREGQREKHTQAALRACALRRSGPAPAKGRQTAEICKRHSKGTEEKPQDKP